MTDTAQGKGSVSIESAKVYRIPGKRYFTLKGAIHGLVVLAVKNKIDDCDCFVSDPTTANEPGNMCTLHKELFSVPGDLGRKIMNRYERMLGQKIRKQMKAKP